MTVHTKTFAGFFNGQQFDVVLTGNGPANEPHTLDRNNIAFTSDAIEVVFLDDDGVLNGDNNHNERSDDTNQKVLINGTEYTGWHDFDIKYTDGNGTLYRFAVIDVDLNGDGVAGSGQVANAAHQEQGQIIVQIEGPTVTAGTSLSFSHLDFPADRNYSDLPAAPTLPNIVEIAAGSDDFNILVQALSTAGLVETVQNAGDITVFAPTDAAFTSLAVQLGYQGNQADEGAVFSFIADTLASLDPNGDPIPLLTDILTYHGKRPSIALVELA